MFIIYDRKYRSVSSDFVRKMGLNSITVFEH